jgi:Raf kinase inhibitor-like YbhB/YbcL family protein
MMRHFLLFGCFFALACSGAECAGAGGSSAILAVDRPETRSAAPLAVTSPAFAANDTIPLTFSPYGQGRSPALAWSGPPAGTKSLALMLEDPDATSVKPFVHWLAWNIDRDLGGLAEASVPTGVRQGRNSHGDIAYFGPRPHGSKPHHYHFQLFALDRMIGLPAGAGREQLLAAMNGHVLAKGDLVGLFAQPPGR